MRPVPHWPLRETLRVSRSGVCSGPRAVRETLRFPKAALAAGRLTSWRRMLTHSKNHETPGRRFHRQQGLALPNAGGGLFPASAWCLAPEGARPGRLAGANPPFGRRSVVARDPTPRPRGLSHSEAHAVCGGPSYSVEAKRSRIPLCENAHCVLGRYGRRAPRRPHMVGGAMKPLRPPERPECQRGCRAPLSGRSSASAGTGLWLRWDGHG